jgi:MFS family permease
MARDARARSVVVVLVSVSLLVIASNLQTSLLSLRAGLEGFREESIGLLMSAFFLGFTGGSVVTVRFLRSVGYIRTFAALASVASAVALLHGLIVTPAVWAGLRFVYGLCYAGLVLIVESWLNQEAESEVRGRVLAVYGLVFMVGSGVGQLGLTVAPIRGLVLFAVVSVVLSFSLVPTNLVRISEPNQQSYRRFSLTEVFRFSPYGVVGVVAAGLVGSVFWSLLPRVVQLLGMGTSQVAVVMAVGVGGAAVMQWPLGHFSDSVDRRYVIIAAAAVAACPALALSASPRMSPEWLVLAIGVFGGFALPLYSVCLAHVNDHLPREDLVPAAATIVLIFGLASAAGPVLASLPLRMLGPRGVFLYAAVVLVAFVLYSLFRLPVRPAVRRPAKRMFQALPRTTHLTARFLHHRAREPGRHDDFADDMRQKDTQ